MGCRIEIRVSPRRFRLGGKFFLFDIEDGRFLENKSGTALLEYSSRRAAGRGHDKHCRHDDEQLPDKAWDAWRELPVVDGSEKARDNAAEVRDPVEVCDECSEGGDMDDPLAEWLTLNDKHKLAHGQCGEDAGWRLA